MKKPATMTSCEKLDNLELAVIRQSSIRVWLESGEQHQGVARALVTRDGADWLTLEENDIDVKQVLSMALLD